MKPGYNVSYSLTYDIPNIIECVNFKGLQEVKFYYWDGEMQGDTKNTVAIFKIKPKSK